MTTLLMRHGETEWNVAGRKQGRGNSPLTAKGKEQALECGRTISSTVSEELVVYVSPLGRAQETCELVCLVLEKPAKNIVSVNDLAEHDYGSWQGLTDLEIDQQFPNERQQRYQNHWNYRIPNGESYAMLNERVSAWLQQVDLTNSLIIAHEMVNRVILGVLLQLPAEETLQLKHPHKTIFRLDGNSVTKL